MKVLVLVGMLAVMGLACGSGVEDCGSMEWWVKRLSSENPSRTGGLEVRSVSNVQEVGKTETWVHCLGLANLENGAAVPVEFRSYIGSDGDVKVGFSVLE